MHMGTWLITGGAGYIGSHTIVELISSGYGLVVLDNFVNSDSIVFERIRQITGKNTPYVQADILDQTALECLFTKYAQAGEPIQGVIHFAGLKAVAESVQDPLRYYTNNVEGTLSLLRAMHNTGIKRIVFSSSATVYGRPELLPFTENHQIAPINPYGRTKAQVEQILQDYCAADPEFLVVALRYFNPIGAHPLGLIGENPCDIPNNLFPYITQVASGKLDLLHVYGDDYPTVDGTGVRDYLHIMDLAQGHVKAVEHMLRLGGEGFEVYNLGTGTGTSVLQMVERFSEVNNIQIPYSIQPRRSGDLAAYWADSEKAQKILGWQANYTLDDMCRDGWQWQKNNPRGYE